MWRFLEWSCKGRKDPVNARLEPTMVPVLAMTFRLGEREHDRDQNCSMRDFSVSFNQDQCHFNRTLGLKKLAID